MITTSSCGRRPYFVKFQSGVFSSCPTYTLLVCHKLCMLVLFGRFGRGTTPLLNLFFLKATASCYYGLHVQVPEGQYVGRSLSMVVTSFHPFQSKWAPSAVIPFHYHFSVHKMPFILFSCMHVNCLHACLMYIYHSHYRTVMIHGL